MKKLVFIFLLITSFIGFSQETSFTVEALNEKFLTVEGEANPFSEILKQHEGKMVFIDIWASWCKDCIASMPDIHELQKQYADIDFIFLSLDKNDASWKKGIEKYKVEGDNYFISEGWKGKFCESIDLDWIPRYMLIDKTGEILVYKAIKVKDKTLQKQLKQ